MRFGRGTDYITAPTPPPAAAAVTWEGRVRKESAHPQSDLGLMFSLYPTGGGTDATTRLQAFDQGGAISVRAGNAAGSGSTLITGGAIDHREERHLAFVADAAGLSTYVDGGLAATTPLVGGLYAAASVLQISGRWGPNFPWLGSIRDVRVWSVARTQQQIREGMRDGITGREQGLVAWYPLDTDVKDYAVKQGTTGRGFVEDFLGDGPLLGRPIGGTDSRLWTAGGTSVFSTLGGAAVKTSVAGYSAGPVADIGALDAIVEAEVQETPPNPGDAVGVYLRYLDASNHVYARLSNALIDLVAVNAGVATTLYTGPAPRSSGAISTLRVDVWGQRVVLLYDGAERYRGVPTTLARGTKVSPMVYSAAGTSIVRRITATPYGQAAPLDGTVVGSPRHQLALQR
jgi:hypothetical protein